jgi:hypothetical protein
MPETIVAGSTMIAVVTNRYPWRWTMRCWGEWLRRNVWYALLFSVLSFGMVEPLGCIVHCQLWYPLGVVNATVGQHVHHHTASNARVAVVEPGVSGSSHLHPVSPVVADPCFDHTAQCSPSHVPNQPESVSLHEHLAAVIIVILLTIVMLVQHTATSPPSPPPRRTVRPPFRPPIGIAASY